MARRSPVLVLLACHLMMGLTANDFVAADETVANSISTEDRDFFAPAQVQSKGSGGRILNRCAAEQDSDEPRPAAQHPLSA